MQSRHWLIIGCGYVGCRVALQAVAAGERVTAVTRSAARAQELSRLGMTSVIADVALPESIRDLPEADVWLHAVAYDRVSTVPRRTVTVEGLRAVLREAATRAQRFIHLSTASVYGVSDGSWVDETTPARPTEETGRLALEAEQLLSCWSAAPVYWTILRLAGIYGPGRLIARGDQLRRQQTLAGSGDAWINLIHVEDIVRTIQRVVERASPASLYLVSDDQPLTRREFYTEFSRLLGTPLPCFELDSSREHEIACRTDGTGAVSNGRTRGLNKRCRNTKLKTELGLELLYPSALTGLAASITG